MRLRGIVRRCAQAATTCARISAMTGAGAPVYFCDSRSPWQRGSNENANVLLRNYFPIGIDVGRRSPQHLLAVETELSKRPASSSKTAHRSSCSRRC